MTDSPSDDARLGATEAHMRRVLGLHGDTPRQSATDHSTTTTNGSHPQRRRFVRDGEVPVIVVNRDHRQDDASGGNQLDAARQAIRSQAAARERAELMLAEAQATIKSLQTTLAHERLAKDEAVRRVEAEKQARQTIQSELVIERAVRERLERSLTDSQANIQDLLRKLEGVRSESVAARRMVEDMVGAVVAAPANRHDTPVPTVRRPVGRPRKTAALQTVEKPVVPSGKVPARPDTVSAKGSTKPDRAAQRRAGKPIKWWLTGR